MANEWILVMYKHKCSNTLHTGHTPTLWGKDGMKAKKSIFSGSHIKAAEETVMGERVQSRCSELLQANTVGLQWTHGGRKGGKTSSSWTLHWQMLKAFVKKQKKKKEWYSNFNKRLTKTFCLTKVWNIKKHVKSISSLCQKRYLEF